MSFFAPDPLVTGYETTL